MKNTLEDRVRGEERFRPTTRRDCPIPLEETGAEIYRFRQELKRTFMGGHLLKLRVKYCGGCNPDIDRGAVVDRFLKIVAASGQEVKCSNDDPDVILLVNGCAHACLEQDDLSTDRGAMCISVQGAHVDRQPVPEPCLHEVIRELITRARPGGDCRGSM